MPTAHNPKVNGSNPFPATNYKSNFNLHPHLSTQYHYLIISQILNIRAIIVSKKDVSWKKNLKKS